LCYDITRFYPKPNPKFNIKQALNNPNLSPNQTKPQSTKHQTYNLWYDILTSFWCVNYNPKLTCVIFKHYFYLLIIKIIDNNNNNNYYYTTTQHNNVYFF
jgi:hypothetical protein